MKHKNLYTKFLSLPVLIYNLFPNVLLWFARLMVMVIFMVNSLVSDIKLLFGGGRDNRQILPIPFEGEGNSTACKQFARLIWWIKWYQFPLQKLNVHLYGNLWSTIYFIKEVLFTYI